MANRHFLKSGFVKPQCVHLDGSVSESDTIGAAYIILTSWFRMRSMFRGS
jgi:hypothetical protein